MNSVAVMSPRRAFSLVELIVVIAVIAIIAGLAIPALFDFSNKAIFAKDRRNAQTIAAIAGAAKAAGSKVDLSDTNAIIRLQPPGVTAVVNGGDVSFSISELSETEETNAAAFLVANSDTNGAVLLIQD